MNCCTYNCDQGRDCPVRVTRVKCSTPKFHTQDGGESVNTGLPITLEDEPDTWREWVPAVLLAVVCVALYASWVYWR